MNFLQRTVLSVTVVTAMSTASFAQGDIDDLLKESISDGEKLIDGYIAPFMKSTALGLNSGWYNTAKPHKLIGIDLTVTVNAMVIPNSELFYNVGDMQLDRVELAPGSQDYPNAPTIFGPERTPQYRIKESGETFNGPDGLDLKGNVGKNWMPVPMVHLGIGLPKGTDLKIRYAPPIDYEGGQVKVFGLGVMHDVKQYIPGIKLLPFDLSAFVGFTSLKLDYKYTDQTYDFNTENPRAEMAMTATTIQGIISKKISVLTVYGGAGYNIVKSNLDVKGKWDVNQNNTYDPQEIDPIGLNYSASGPRVTAGFRLKLAVFTLHADYTLQKYNTLSAGFGINVR